MSMTPTQEARYALDYRLGPDDLRGEARAEYDRLAAERVSAPAAVPVQAPVPSRAREDRSSWPHAVADGLAVGSLIASLFGFSIVGVIVGAIHVSNAHKERKRGSAVAAWGIGLGIAGLVAEVVLVIVLIAAMAAVSHAGYSTSY
jgi:hypothetical protein